MLSISLKRIIIIFVCGSCLASNDIHGTWLACACLAASLAQEPGHPIGLDAARFPRESGAGGGGGRRGGGGGKIFYLANSC
jgi:hypothetical protein